MISRLEITPLAVLHACNVDTTLMVVLQQAGVLYGGRDVSLLSHKD